MSSAKHGNPTKGNTKTAKTKRPPTRAGAKPREDNGRNDELLVIPEARATRMDDIFEVQGNQIRMYYWPEELIITPR